MTSVINLIRHYQKDIEKCPDNEARVLRCLSKLHQLGVTVQHLQDTGVGRTVNALRKEPGEVGTAARALVAKWKHMVASAEDSSEDDGNQHNSGRDSAEDSDHNAHQSMDNESDHETGEYINYQTNGDISGSSKRRQSDEDYCSRKRGKYEDTENDSNNEENGSHKKFKIKEKQTDSEDYNHHYKKNLSESSENEQEHLTIKEEIKSDSEQEKNKRKSSKHEKEQKQRDKSGHSHKHHSENRHRSEKESKKHSSSDEKERKRDKESREHKSKRSEKNLYEKDKSSEKISKSEDSSPKTLSLERTSSKDKSSYRSSEKYTSSKNKDDYKESESSKGREQRSSSSDQRDHSKDKSRSHKDIYENQEKVHNNGEIKKDKEKHRSSELKSKHNDQSSSHSHKSKSDRSSSESKNKTDKLVKSVEEKRSDKTSSSSKRKSSSSKSSSKDKDEMPKKKSKLVDKADSDEGIGCESGASFAEALGMVSPVKTKKKTESSSTSSTTSSSNKASTSNGGFTVPTSLLAPSAKLEPLQPLEISALPEISPNYKPRPPPKLLPHINEDDALNYQLSTKNQRTKVFSGNKTYGKVLTLYELCVNVLQHHIDALEYTGGVPYEILKPVVDKATPDQLFSLEHFNPYLIDDTNHLWKQHCEKNFRGQKRREMETWREMYLRCLEEQEARLKSLTANIKKSQDAKNAPTKQTKMAYVDTVVKPPRNIAKKQALYGTARAAVTSPAARVAALASTGVVRAGALPPRPAPVVATHSAPQKHTKAPLMQKALQLMRGRRR